MIIDAVPLIRASQVPPFLAAMDHIGASRERLLRESKLPLLAYDDTEAAVPDLFLWALADRVARGEGIECFGLLAAIHMPLWESEPAFTLKALKGSEPFLFLRALTPLTNGPPFPGGSLRPKAGFL